MPYGAALRWTSTCCSSCVPELRGRVGEQTRRCLPGPYTLVLPNPGRRFRWLGGDRAETIGVRVPDGGGAFADMVRRSGR